MGSFNLAIENTIGHQKSTWFSKCD